MKSGEHRHDNEHFVAGEIFFGNEECSDPADLHQRSSSRAQNRQRIPPLPLRDREQTDVEQRDVNEESERMILAGRKQNRREKAPRKTENGDHDCTEPHREQKRDRGDQRHQQKRWEKTEECEVIIRAAGKRYGVEHKYPGGAKRLRSDRVFLAFEQHAANEKAQADNEADRNAQFRWNEVVLEGILHEKSHAEEKRQTADPREKFCAHELLPIDRRSDRNRGLPFFCVDECLGNWRRLRFFGRFPNRSGCSDGQRWWYRWRRRYGRSRFRERSALPQRAQVVFNG